MSRGNIIIYGKNNYPYANSLFQLGFGIQLKITTLCETFRKTYENIFFTSTSDLP